MQARAHFVDAKEVVVRRQGEVAALVRVLERSRQLRPEPFCGSVEADGIVEIDDGLLPEERQVIENRAEAALEESGQQWLHAEGRNSFPDLLDALADLGRGRGYALSGSAGGGLGQAPGLLGEEQLAGRTEVDLLARIDRALGFGVEDADRLHRVAEELQADRVGVERREDVD